MGVPSLWSTDTSCVATDPKGHSLVEMESIGEALAELDYARIERTVSKTHDTEVWGNVCIECNTYQRNRCIREELLNKVQTAAPRTTITMTPSCKHCEENEATRFEHGHPLCDSCLVEDVVFSQTECSRCIDPGWRMRFLRLEYSAQYAGERGNVSNGALSTSPFRQKSKLLALHRVAIVLDDRG